MLKNGEIFSIVPGPDANGRFPAIETARASVARDIIQQRQSAGLSQTRLAQLAGIRQETLSRIEPGKHTATETTVLKIEQAIRQFLGRRKNSPNP